MFLSHVVFDSFHTAYTSFLRDILKDGSVVGARNIGALELLNVMWVLTNPQDCRVDFSKTGLPERQKIYDDYCQREIEWYLSGKLEADSAPAKFWTTIANPHGSITSNYGHMILHDRKYPGNRTAEEVVLDTLMEDSHSRQAVIHYSQPKDYWPGNRDIPCTMSSQFFIRDGWLLMATTQRSCDAFLGWPYDVVWNCFLMQRIAEKLKVKLGGFTHVIGSLHLYEKDVDKAKKIVAFGKETWPAEPMKT